MSTTLTTQDESDANGNPYPKYNYTEGVDISCTWYVWDYAYNKLGIRLPGTWGQVEGWGDARSWYAKAAADPAYEVGSAPQVNSIAVYDGGDYGHVEIVTAVNGTDITVSSGGWYGTGWQSTHATVEGLTKSGIAGQNGLLGYIYLVRDNPLTVTAFAKSLKDSAVKGAAKKVSPFAVANAMTPYTFRDAGSDKRLSVASDGKVAVKKGTPEGSYKARVTVHAEGNAQYRAADVQAEATVTVVSTAPTYKVRFIANGGKGAMGIQSIKRGKKTALGANAFTRSGYKFTGWNAKKNGKGKSYKNKAKVKNLAKAGKTVKLYAQWKKTSGALTLKQAKSVYSSALKDLESKNYRVYYKYADIVGDKTVELVAYAFPGEGMRSHDYIYTIKSGKPKLIHDRSSYGYWGDLTYRKSAKSLIYYGSGHGGDSYLYLKFNGSKYNIVAWKSKSWGARAWSYSKPSGATTVPISESAFSKSVKGLDLGNGKTLDLAWNTMGVITNESNR